MDKEIIIDGVKVEECSYYNKDNTPYCCEVWDNECEAQNCYYKQLKRLEQENAELKAENDRLREEVRTEKIYSSQIEELEESLNHLKQENDRLKEEILKWQKAYSRQYQINENKGYSKKEEQYHQTLQEIKEIAEEWMKDYCYLDNYNDSEGCCICHEKADCYNYRLLKAITKAEEE